MSNRSKRNRTLPMPKTARPTQTNQLRTLRRSIVGESYIPSEVPPVVTGQPWNPATLMFKMSLSPSGNADYKFLKLKEVIMNQLGFANTPPANINFDVRIQSVAIWIDNGSVVFTPADFLSYSLAELARIDSYPMKNMYARVGYRYPLHLQSTTLTTKNTNVNPILWGIAVSVATSAQFAVNILWKGSETKAAIKVIKYKYRDSESSLLKALQNKLDAETFKLVEQEFLQGESSDDDDQISNISKLSLNDRV